MTLNRGAWRGTLMETLSRVLHQKMRVGVGGVATVTPRRHEARCDGAHLARRPDTVRRRPESCLFHSWEDFQSFLLRIRIKGGTSKGFYICPKKIQPHNTGKDTPLLEFSVLLMDAPCLFWVRIAAFRSVKPEISGSCLSKLCPLFSFSIH